MVAKAPRKQLAPVRPMVSPGCGKSKKGGSKLGGGGNTVKTWATPEWQKGIQTFLSGGDGGECSSSSSSADTSLITERPPKDLDVSNSGSEDMDSEEQCSSPAAGISPLDSSSQAAGLYLLDSSITQLNSDDEDD